MKNKLSKKFFFIYLISVIGVWQLHGEDQKMISVEACYRKLKEAKGKLNLVEKECDRKLEALKKACYRKH